MYSWHSNSSNEVRVVNGDKIVAGPFKDLRTAKACIMDRADDFTAQMFRDLGMIPSPVMREIDALRAEVANGTVCPWCGGLGYTVERVGYDSEESCQCYFCHGGYFTSDDIKQDYESMEAGNKKLRAELAIVNRRIEDATAIINTIEACRDVEGVPGWRIKELRDALKEDSCLKN